MEPTPIERLAKRYAERWTPRTTMKVVAFVAAMGFLALFNWWLATTPSGMAFWVWVQS